MLGKAPCTVRECICCCKQRGSFDFGFHTTLLHHGSELLAELLRRGPPEGPGIADGSILGKGVG
jgi:hypothetical protein